MVHRSNQSSGRVDSTSELANQAKEKRQICVSFGQVLQPLVRAAEQHCSWIDDFRDDEITLPLDLYDVLMAFSQLKQGRVSDRKAA